MRLFSTLCVSVLALTAALPAAAQDRSFSFALRTGVAATPEYLGSDDIEARGDFGFTFGSLQWGRVNLGDGVRTVPNNGVSLRSAFRIIGDREVDDSPELAGLEDIDTTVELGLGLTYQQTNWMVFGEVRKGIGGHTGFTGTLGSDIIYRPTNKWLFTVGPRFNFGDSDFASTYFDVPVGTTSSFTPFDASGGVLGAGVEVGATYFIDDKWALEGALSYERLLNDAADSPITLNGSDDQWRLRVGVSRVFTINF